MATNLREGKLNSNHTWRRMGMYFVPKTCYMTKPCYGICILLVVNNRIIKTLHFRHVTKLNWLHMDYLFLAAVQPCPREIGKLKEYEANQHELQQMLFDFMTNIHYYYHWTSFILIYQLFHFYYFLSHIQYNRVQFSRFKMVIHLYTYICFFVKTDWFYLWIIYLKGLHCK